MHGCGFVTDCLLNQNSKVAGGAHCAGVYSPVIDLLRGKGWRIEQMPCPELAFTGLNRFWMVREQLCHAEVVQRARLEALLDGGEPNATRTAGAGVDSVPGGHREA